MKKKYTQPKVQSCNNGSPAVLLGCTGLFDCFTIGYLASGPGGCCVPVDQANQDQLCQENFC